MKPHFFSFPLMSVLLLISLIVPSGYTQDTKSPAVVDNIRFTIENDVQVSDYSLEFDLYIKDLDITEPFDLQTVQAGILINSAISSGTLTSSVVPGYSDLPIGMQPLNTTITPGTPNSTFKMSGGPGCGNGTIISTGINPPYPDPLGTKVCRIRLTNSVAFAYAQPNLTFNFTTTPYPTKVFQFYGTPCSSTELTANSSNCVSHAANLYLNGKSLQMKKSMINGFQVEQEASFPDDPADFLLQGIAPDGLNSFLLSIENDVQITDRVLEFDLYLKDTDAADPFELSMVQAGILVNSTILNGGTPTLSIVPGSSQLLITQQPIAISYTTGSPTGCIKLAARTLAPCGSFYASSTGLGSRINRFRITSSTPLVSGTQANLTFNFTITPYPTKIFYYAPNCGSVVTLNCSSANSYTGTTYQNSSLTIAKSWSGLANSSWSNPANWSGGIIPANNDNVTLPGSCTNYPVITSGTTLAKSVIITNGASLTINPNAALTLSGRLTIDGTDGLIIQSDATGTGSLIDNGISGPGTAQVKRYLSGYTSSNDGIYHFISSPVSNQSIQPEFVNLPNSVNDFYKFDEVTNTWVNSRTPSGTWNSNFETTFTINRGYLVSYNTNTTKTFSGTLNSASAPVQITCTNTIQPGGSGNGWNLIGNPFPSAIDYNLITCSGMDAAIYYYNAASSSYVSFIPPNMGSGSRYIPAMQGWMMHAQSGGGTVTLDNSIRTHSGQNFFYKNEQKVLSNYLMLTVSGNGYFDEAYLHVTDEAQPEFDGNLDAFKLFGFNPQVPMIYTLTPEFRKLSINSIPPEATTSPVPLALKVNADGPYTITASELQTFQPDVTIILEDTKTGEMQNLMNIPTYSFQAVANDPADRFRIHFSGTLGTPEIKPTPVKIYSSGNTVSVSTGSSIPGIVVITDLLGREILFKNTGGNLITQIPVDAVTGYYLVKVQTDSSVVVRKVFIRN